MFTQTLLIIMCSLSFPFSLVHIEQQHQPVEAFITYIHIYRMEFVHKYSFRD